MATNAYLTYHDGKLEIPEDLRAELRLQEGSRLHVVSVANQIVLDRSEAAPAVSLTFDWHTLRGSLADPDIDLNEELEKDRIEELASDARLV